jgi:hypothetical protein
MRKKLLAIVFSISIALTLHAQNDREAISVLDKFSANASSSPSVYMDFLLVTDINLTCRIILSGSMGKPHGVICLLKRR